MLARSLLPVQDQSTIRETRMAYQTIAIAPNLAIARVLALALRAHGFHPLDRGDGGMPGVRGAFAEDGVQVQVPEEEAADATLLAAELLRDMTADEP
jgi:hypothetical protein